MFPVEPIPPAIDRAVKANTRREHFETGSQHECPICGLRIGHLNLTIILKPERSEPREYHARCLIGHPSLLRAYEVYRWRVEKSLE